MGGSLSSSTTTTSTNPTDSDKQDSPIPTDSNSPNPNMSSPDPQNLESDSPIETPIEQPDQSIKETKTGEEIGEGEEEEEEEEGECGFCLFMKGGGCKDAFVEWEKCIEDAEKKKEEIVVKCFDVTSALKKCMEAHPDYYEPILRAEKMAEEELEREMKDSNEPEVSENKASSSEN